MVLEEGASTGNGNGNKMNMRINILEGLLAQNGDAHSARANSLKQTIKRNKTDMADTPSKSLDLMRRVFQKELTNELKQVLERHLRTTFSPALENLKRNGHDVSDDDVNELCRSILEAAKKPFGAPTPPPPQVGQKRGYESGEESDVSLASFSSQTKKRRRGRPRKDELSEQFNQQGVQNQNQPPPPSMQQQGIGINQGHDVYQDLNTTANQMLSAQQTMQKWNPDRIASNSRFVTAHQVCAVLNLPLSSFQTKYPRTFKYMCDDEDRQYLCDVQYQSPSLGKQHLFLLEDISEILGRPLMELDRSSFLLSENILQKVRARTAFTYEQLKTRFYHATSAPRI